MDKEAICGACLFLDIKIGKCKKYNKKLESRSVGFYKCFVCRNKTKK